VESRRMTRILVVDNDAGVRHMLELAIPTFGFSVLLAASGAEAVEIYQSETVDFVLLDIQMPGMDGMQTLAALKIIDPGVMVCFMSSSSIPTSDDLARLGAVGFIQKPFHLDDLRRIISTQLGL
jgi:DNA-binding NtrC family response regulator